MSRWVWDVHHVVIEDQQPSADSQSVKLMVEAMQKAGKSQTDIDHWRQERELRARGGTIGNPFR